MMRISVNFTAVTSQKPPVLVFTICLLSFVLVLASFIVYIKTHEINNPDELDWNHFREKMALLDYCVKYPIQDEVKQIGQSTSKEAAVKSIPTEKK